MVILEWNPLNRGHIGTSRFVHYREVILFQTSKYIYIANSGTLRTVLFREVILSSVVSLV